MSIVTGATGDILEGARAHDSAQSAVAQSLIRDLDGQAFDPSRSWTEEREATIAFLRQQYDFRSESVATYLRPNSDLAWMLIGAMPALQSAFGGAVVVTLAFIADPEVEGRAEQLFGYIRSMLTTEDALAALDRFDGEWLLDRVDKIGGRLGFDLSF